jgi:hypothetical protein
MTRSVRPWPFALIAAALVMAATPTAAQALYPRMAPIEQYQIADRAEEIALARTAAPAWLSERATVLVLGARGYETAVEGANGFVCIVVRSWANTFESEEFWNSQIRAPQCVNAAAARSVLSTYLTRTEWVLAGVSKDEMMRRTQAASASGAITPPETGAVCYMLSKHGYLSDHDHHGWRPHVMFYLPRTEPSALGANHDEHGPIFADHGGVEPMTVFMVPVTQWSDGTPWQ